MNATIEAIEHLSIRETTVDLHLDPVVVLQLQLRVPDHPHEAAILAVEPATVKVVEDEVDLPAEAEDEVIVDVVEEWALVEVASRLKDLRARATPDQQTTRHQSVKSDSSKQIETFMLTPLEVVWHHRTPEHRHNRVYKAVSWRKGATIEQFEK